MAKILVIDDSITFRTNLVEILKDYEVIEANNGIEALLILRKTTDISLILVDFHMPGMTGLEFCNKKQQIPNYVDTPVIFITTETDKKTKEKVKQLGAKAWTNKPIDPTSLLAGIEYILKKTA